MSSQSSYKNYKESMERRQKYGPLILGGAAVVIIAVGLFLIILSMNGTGLSLAFLHSPTPTFTNTATPVPPTATPTETATPTITSTPTETLVPTPAEPFEYQVQSGDNITIIADQFGVDFVSILLLNNLTNDSVLYVGDTIVIPNPDMERPTPSPLPPNLPRGSVIDYFVLPGDSLVSIADEFNSIVDDILEENDMDEDSVIYPGQILKVPYLLITPTFGPTETATPEVSPTETPTPSQTPQG